MGHFKNVLRFHFLQIILTCLKVVLILLRLNSYVKSLSQHVNSLVAYCEATTTHTYPILIVLQIEQFLTNYSKLSYLYQHQEVDIALYVFCLSAMYLICGYDGQIRPLLHVFDQWRDELMKYATSVNKKHLFLSSRQVDLGYFKCSLLKF